MKIVDYYGLNKKDGEVGVEIEIEANYTPKFNSGGWSTHTDGSLRSPDPAEYVFSQPVPRSEVGGLLEYWHKKMFEGKDRVQGLVDPCPRSGVHVHLNVQQLSFKDLITFYSLYGIVEDLLVRFCGEEREGNLFCLRNCDAEGVIKFVRDIAITGGWASLSSDVIRYASLNLCAVPKFGSVEFRAMRGTVDINLIKTWVDMLLKLKDSAATFKKPSDIISSFSAAGELAFLRSIMGDYSELLHAPNMRKSIRDGMRRMQDLAFCEVVEPKTAKKKKSDFNDAARMMDPEEVDGNHLRPLGVFNENWPMPNESDSISAQTDEEWSYWLNENRNRFVLGLRVIRVWDDREREEDDEGPDFEDEPEEVLVTPPRWNPARIIASPAELRWDAVNNNTFAMIVDDLDPIPNREGRLRAAMNELADRFRGTTPSYPRGPGS